MLRVKCPIGRLIGRGAIEMKVRKDIFKSHLKLVDEAYLAQRIGPITRLGLTNRYKPVPRWQLAMVITTKLILAATVIYVAYSFR